MNDGVIHSNDKLQADLLFDETEFSIQRRVGEFIVLTAFVAISAFAVIFCALHTHAIIMFSLLAVILIAAIMVIAYVLRQRNNNDVYTYNQVSSLSISEPKKYFYELRFAFNNGKSDCICVCRSQSLLNFVSIIQGNRVKFDFKSEFDVLENFENKQINGVIKLDQTFKAELMFDNDVFCINYKLVTDLYQAVFVFVLVLGNIFLRFSAGINTRADIIIVAFFIVALLFVVYLYPFKYRKLNSGVYSYSQVHHVEVKTNSSGKKMLQINLVNGSAIKLRLGLSSNLNSFINLLKMKQVEVIQQ